MSNQEKFFEAVMDGRVVLWKETHNEGTSSYRFEVEPKPVEPLDYDLMRKAGVHEDIITAMMENKK